MKKNNISKNGTARINLFINQELADKLDEFKTVKAFNNYLTKSSVMSLALKMLLKELENSTYEELYMKYNFNNGDA